MSQVPNSQPTNQDEISLPACENEGYISLRITLSHEQKHIIEAHVVFDAPAYIIYPHKGTKTQKDHFHVCIAGVEMTPKTVEKYRKRVSTHIGKGNGFVSAKMHATLPATFVAYVKHEAGKPILQGFSLEWFNEIAAMDINTMDKQPGFGKPAKKPRNEDHFKQITYMNMERVTMRYRKEHGITSVLLEDTLEAMHKDGWRLQITVMRGGIPQQFFDEFTAQCKNKTTFKASRFVMMRKLEQWRQN